MKPSTNYWFPKAFAMIVLVLFLSSGCATNWFLSPRDRSIKEWESRQQNSKNRDKDSVVTSNSLSKYQNSKL